MKIHLSIMHLKMWSAVFVVLMAVGTIRQSEDEQTYLPVVNAQITQQNEPLLSGYIQECIASSQTTSITGKSDTIHTSRVALATTADGAPTFISDLDTVILSPEGPLSGDWWVWLVNQNGAAISQRVVVHTDDQPGFGKCQKATVKFYTPHHQGQPTFRPLAWDSRLTDLTVYLIPAQESSGDTVWRLIEAKWENEQEAQGENYIYVEVLDQNGQRILGQPVTVFWTGGGETRVTEDISNQDYSFKFRMHKPGNAYNVKIESISASDILIGAGLGIPELPMHTIYTNFKLTFQQVVIP